MHHLACYSRNFRIKNNSNVHAAQIRRFPLLARQAASTQHSRHSHSQERTSYGSWDSQNFMAGLAIAGLTAWAIMQQQEAAQCEEKEEGFLGGNLPKEFVVQLQKLLDERFVIDQSTNEYHGKDQSFNKGMAPDAVVYPTNTQEVSKIVKLCAQYQVPIIPFGAGTSLEGHISALHGGISVDFKQMSHVVAVYKDDMQCVVQPGLSYGELNEKLVEYGVFFPMDPGPGASIGGMVGTSCSGTNAVRYGTMKENVVNLTVVLPNGQIVKTASRAKKSAAGYDLTHLFIGSEGTLGLVTEITLKLYKRPETISIAVREFDSIGDATNAVIRTIQKGVPIGKVEMLDELMLKAVNQNSNRAYAEKPTLFFEFSGSKAAVEEQLRDVEAILKDYTGGKLKFALDDDEREELWLARKTALWAAPILKPGAETKITDVCVPISRLADCINETRADLAESFLLAPMVGHAGDGNFHLFMLVDPNNEKDMAEAMRLDHRLIERAIAMGGSCTGEHGVGLGKMKYLPLELGQEAVDLMRVIKTAIDPQMIMNPGKIFPKAPKDKKV